MVTAASPSRSVPLFHPPVTEIAVAGALHDGLRAGELDAAAKAIGDGEVGRAHQQEAQLGLAERLVELGVAAARDIQGEGVVRLLVDAIIERLVLRVGPERRRHRLPEVRLVLVFPERLAETAVEIAERLADEAV